MTVWIYTDADNTLWDTDAVFAKAQLSLLEATERIAGMLASAPDRLEYVRSFDQAIALHHHSKLRYPPVLLIRAVSEGLRSRSAQAAARAVLNQGAVATAAEAAALKQYGEILSSVPSLLQGVREGLELAHEAGSPVYVISEGSTETLRRRLAAWQLEPWVSEALSAEKTPALYARLKQRAAPHHAVMVGDQLDRDIRCARAGGLRAVLVRGRFTPKWIQTADESLADAVVNDFLAAIQWALRVS